MQNFRTLTARLLTAFIRRPAIHQRASLWTACKLTQDQNVLLLSRHTATQPVQAAASGCRYCSAITNSHMVILENLGYKVTEQDIVDFLKDGNVVVECNGVNLVRLSSGLRAGKAFVKLSSQQDIEKLLNLKNRELCQRKVKVTRFNEESLSGYCESRDQKLYQSQTGHTIEFHTVPDGTTNEMLEDFFAPIKPVAVQVFKAHSRNRAWEKTKATVDLATHSDILEAMNKDGQTLGDMSVRLSPVSYDGICTGYSNPKPNN